MRYKRYIIPTLVGLLLLVTVVTNYAMAGDPLDKDDDFLYGDPDGDEILTWEEFLLGTDPYNADSDFDGIPDYWEYVIGEMDPSDASDAHEDHDYDPSTNFSIGEREATFDAVKKDIDVWPSDRSVTFVEPMFDEDGPHYDNYEEYYRPYHDQYDNMKVKIMNTLPQKPDSDGDGKLDPDDYEPFNFKNDGLGAGGADAPASAINQENDFEVKKLDSDELNHGTNVEVQFTSEPQESSYDFNVAPEEPEKEAAVENKKKLLDSDNDGI